MTLRGHDYRYLKGNESLTVLFDTILYFKFLYGILSMKSACLSLTEENLSALRIHKRSDISLKKKIRFITTLSQTNNVQVVRVRSRDYTWEHIAAFFK